MGLFDTLKDKVMNNEQVQAKLEEIKQQQQSGELTEKGKQLFESVRTKLGK